jgi:tRNA/rRNA methyltransferase
VSLHVVLVEPAGPLNLGSVARLCTNFAVTSLRLVAPRCDPLAPEARRMAVHGLPMLEGARVYPTLAAALADCGRIVATTGRDEGAPLPLLPPAEALAWLVAVPPSSSSGPGATALVFGREDRGLTNQELLQAGRLLRIGTGPAYASLNLSHAVAVVLHELHQLRGAAAAPAPGQAPSAPLQTSTAAQDPCRRDQLEAALDDAEALLLEVGFLLPHTRRARMAKLRALLQRGQITAAEVALMRGMVCQLRWASRRGAAATDAP